MSSTVRAIRYLREGFSVKETAHLLNLRPHKVEAIRARHHLPFNDPIPPGSTMERDAVNLLIFFRGEPHPDLCNHLSQTPGNLIKLRSRIHGAPENH